LAETSIATSRQSSGKQGRGSRAVRTSPIPPLPMREASNFFAVAFYFDRHHLIAAEKKYISRPSRLQTG
jgi:hypothetical protein